jgi:flagellar motor protein MotB
LSAVAHDEETGQPTHVWVVFGDLMACLFGLFVLFFVWAIAFQVDLTQALESERRTRAEEAAKHAAESARLAALERALAGPLAEGRITLEGGKIGIRGSVLFDLASADLRPDGVELLRSLGEPLRVYLEQHDETIMVSGFTDSAPIGPGQRYEDNWELSAQRALTVTRSLEAAGVPSRALVAAGFGDTNPIAPNDTAENRAKNRRVEIAPIPRKGSSP